MTDLGFTGNIVAILVLLLVIVMTWLMLRLHVREWAVTFQRKRADKGKIKCYATGGHEASANWRCKNKAGWVTPRGYFCDEHWEINSKRDSHAGRVRWANKLAWKRNGVEV